MAEDFSTDSKLFKTNEKDANVVMSKVCAASAVLLLIIIILTACDFFAFIETTKLLIYIFFSIESVFLLVPFALRKTKIFDKKSTKFFEAALFITVIFMLNMILPKHGILAWAALIILTNLYYSPKFTRNVFLITVVLMAIDIPLGMLVGEWDANLLNITEASFKSIGLDPNSVEDRLYWLNHYDQLGGTALNRWASAFVYYYFARVAILAIIYITCRSLSIRTRNLITEEAKQITVNEKISSDLNVASSIQNAVLPKEFPNSSLGSIYAFMNPAKEVGGDLYDFFSIDESHFVLCVADVSGKGIPAALFMMKTQSLIHALGLSFAHSKDGYSPAHILEMVNRGVVEGNELNLFVTCWLGIFDLDKGELIYSNAGHNPPLFLHDGKFNYIEEKPELVLGAFLNHKYTNHKIMFDPGDKIFIYSDGVTEAHDTESQLYGEKRLLDFMNNHNLSPKNSIDSLLKDIKIFCKGAEQFDDITMLMFENRNKNAGQKVFPAKKEELNNVLAYVEHVAEPLNFSMKEINQILICVEEIFVNIASYSYEEEGFMTLITDVSNNELKVVFIDSGIEFNPLERENPDITMSADDRGIGGLGIFMVKTMMDDVTYSYENSHNILTIVKKKKENKENE